MPISQPFKNAQSTVPIFTPSNLPKKSSDIATATAQLMQSYAILNLLISR